MLTKCNYVGCSGTFQSKEGVAFAKYLFEDRMTNKVIAIDSDDIQRKFDKERPYYIETYKGDNGWVSRLLEVN